jgi:hypothetical protein
LGTALGSTHDVVVRENTAIAGRHAAVARTGDTRPPYAGNNAVRVRNARSAHARVMGAREVSGRAQYASARAKVKLTLKQWF